jgi:hypothetical protein
MKGVDRKAVSYWLKVVVVGVLIGAGLQIVQAWTSPTDLPPGGNVAGPLTTGSGDQVKAGKLRSASTVTTDPGTTLATKDYVDAAGYVRGGHYGGCAIAFDASNTPWVHAGSFNVVWPMTSCATKNPVCDSGFSPIFLSFSQMNTGFSLDYNPACGAADINCKIDKLLVKFNRFLDGDMMWAIYACAKN